ncbi:Seizure protein 6 [Frankliniella fusca]|uniref:Seizure protein 6 n=1 Tax=Frankliniella fusca TaxID=407009 RepID=A0AAE1L731_9NEOP|nr:Seizure protein 6 [Frankliniella fusca]
MRREEQRQLEAVHHFRRKSFLDIHQNVVQQRDIYCLPEVCFWRFCGIIGPVTLPTTPSRQNQVSIDLFCKSFNVSPNTFKMFLCVSTAG